MRTTKNALFIDLPPSVLAQVEMAARAMSITASEFLVRYYEEIVRCDLSARSATTQSSNYTEENRRPSATNE